jgi:hypothetical protein
MVGVRLTRVGGGGHRGVDAGLFAWALEKIFNREIRQIREKKSKHDAFLKSLE